MRLVGIILFLLFAVTIFSQSGTRPNQIQGSPYPNGILMAKKAYYDHARQDSFYIYEHVNMDSLGFGNDTLVGNEFGNALRTNDSLFYRQCPTCPYNFVTKIDTSNVNEFGTLTSPLVGFIYYKSCPTCPNQIIPDRFGYIQDFGSNKSIIFATGEDIEFNDGDGYINLVGGPTTYRLQEDTLNELGNLTIEGDSIYYQACPTCVDSLIGVITHPSFVEQDSVIGNEFGTLFKGDPDQIKYTACDTCAQQVISDNYIIVDDQGGGQFEWIIPEGEGSILLDTTSTIMGLVSQYDIGGGNYHLKVRIPDRDSLNERGTPRLSNDSIFYKSGPNVVEFFVGKIIHPPHYADADSVIGNEFGTPRFSNDSIYYKQCPTCIETFIGKIIHPVNLDNDSANEIQVIDTFSIVSNILYNSLSKDAQPAKTVNLAPYLDNTDSQNLSDGGKTGNLQAINISGGTGTVINIADGDSVKTNELITAFTNTDSIRITEAGVTWAVVDNVNDADPDSLNERQFVDSLGFSGTNTIGVSLSKDETVKTLNARRYEHHLNSSEAEKADNIVFIGDGEVALNAETDLRDKGLSVFRYDPDNVTLLGGAVKVDGFAGLNAVVRISTTDSISIQHYGKHLNVYARGGSDSIRVRSYDADTSFSYAFLSNAKTEIEYQNATGYVGKTPTYDKLWTSVIKADDTLYVHGIIVVGYSNIIDQSKTTINLDSLYAARWLSSWNQVVLVPTVSTDTVGIKQIIANNSEGTVISNNETLIRDALNKDWTAMRLTTNYNSYERSINEVLEDCLNENSNVYDGITAVKGGKIFLKEGNKRYYLKRGEITGNDTLSIDGTNIYNSNGKIYNTFRTVELDSAFLSIGSETDYTVFEIGDGTSTYQQIEAYVNNDDFSKTAFMKLTDTEASIGRTGSTITLADSTSFNLSGSTGTAGQLLTATGTGKAKWQTPATGVTDVTATSPLFSSGGATPNLTIQNASTSQTGALTNTDWNTFNGKVGGSGTTGYFPYFSASSTLADSPLYRLSSTSMALGTTTNTNLLGRAGFNIMNSDPAFAIGKSTSHYWYQFMNGNNFEIYNPNYGSVITLQTDGKFKMTKYAGSGNRYLYANASGEVNVSTYDVISGTGTSNYIPKWTAARTLSPTSLLYDSGSYVGIGTASPSYLLDAQASNYGSYVARFKNAGS